MISFLKRFFSVFIVVFCCLFSLCFPPPLRADDASTAEKELFLVAQKAFDDGFYDVATRYINEFIEKYPQSEKNPQAKLLLGQCYFFQTQYLKAFEIFQELLPNTEFKDATLFWLGETYLKGSDYANAEKQYKQLIDLYPDSTYTPQAYYSMAWSYLDQKKYQDALTVFQSLISKFPAHALAEDAAFKSGECTYNQTHYDEAVEYFKKYILNYPQSTRHDQVYFYIAEANYYLGNFEEAITYYTKTADITKDQKLLVLAKVGTAWSYLKVNNFDQSQKIFEEALAMAQAKGIVSDDIFLGQASLYAQKKDDAKALTAYQQLIDQFPNSPRIVDAYLGKANTLYTLKNYDEAISAYNTIIEKFSKQDDAKDNVEKAHFGLAWTYLKQGNIDQSIASFQNIMDSTENKVVKVSALTQIADAYQDGGRLDKALDVYDRILRDYPDSLYADYVQFRQGIALLKMDKIEPAILSLKSLKANFPQSQYLKDADYYLGLAYFKKGDWNAARDQIGDFLLNVPKTDDLQSQAHYVLASTFFNLKEYDKARQTFETIIKKFPDQDAMVRDSEIGIAKCLYSAGNLKEALERFNLLATKYDQTETGEDALLWLSDYYLEASDFTNAVSYYEKLMEKYPKSSRINLFRFQLGQAYQGKGELDKALNQFKVIEDPTDKELNAKAKLAIADIFSQGVDPEKALSTYENIAESSPEFKRDAYVKIAEIDKNNQKYDEALKAYQNALNADISLSDITNAQLQFSIGDTYELLNQPDKAIESYLKIPYLYNKEVTWVTKAYLRAGRIFEDKSDWDNAKNIYQKVIDLKTDEVKFAQERLDWIKDNSMVHKN